MKKYVVVVSNPDGTLYYVDPRSPSRLISNISECRPKPLAQAKRITEHILTYLAYPERCPFMWIRKGNKTIRYDFDALLFQTATIREIQYSLA